MYIQFLTTAKRGFRIGGSSSNSDYDYHNSFGLGSDYDYEDTAQSENSANAATANTATANTATANTAVTTNNAEKANTVGTTDDASTANGNGQANTAEGTNTAATTSTSETNTIPETTNPEESTNTEEVSTTAAAAGKDGATGATNTPSTLFPEVRPSGLIIEYLSKPNVCERTAEKGNILTMHYTGILQADGTKFDSSVTKNQPHKFQLGVGQVCGIEANLSRSHFNADICELKTWENQYKYVSGDQRMG